MRDPGGQGADGIHALGLTCSLGERAWLGDVERLDQEFVVFELGDAQLEDLLGAGGRLRFDVQLEGASSSAGGLKRAKVSLWKWTQPAPSSTEKPRPGESTTLR